MNALVVWSDIGCPWSHLLVHRLHERREALGLRDRVTFDMRPFLLEVVNGRPTPKITLDLEMAVCGGVEPDAGWRMWSTHLWEYPVSTLLAMEAVEAAKEQGLEASAQLDRALRRAFFTGGRTITMRHVILEEARAVDEVDEGLLAKALDTGAARERLMTLANEAFDGDVKGSPHVFLPDGSDVHNPGIDLEWVGPKGRKVPRITRDAPSEIDDLLRRAAG